MAGKKQNRPLKDNIVPVRMTDGEVKFLEDVADKMEELNPLMARTNKSEIVMILIKLGYKLFKAKYSPDDEPVSKRERKTKI